MNENRDMLNEQDKGIEAARGVLAYLFRKIIFDRNIDGFEWGIRMNRYLDDPRNGVPRNGKDRSSARGNLNKELRKARMTWKVFEKAMRFLGPLSLRFEVHLKWETGEESVHGVTIALRPGGDEGKPPELMDEDDVGEDE